jgi:hypothetical protein
VRRLRRFLVNTGERVLVEASPVDRIWGIGLTADHSNATDLERWPGLNLLGFALMQVRAILRSAEHAAANRQLIQRGINGQRKLSSGRQNHRRERRRGGTVLFDVTPTSGCGSSPGPQLPSMG